MTRVNLIHPGRLHHSHLISEYRENPRVFGLVRKAQDRGLTPETCGAPDSYRMGSGHVKFFYPRLGFLVVRQMALIQEMKLRGYSPNHDSVHELGDGIEKHWFGQWTPTDACIAANLARLIEKLPHHYGERS